MRIGGNMTIGTEAALVTIGTGRTLLTDIFLMGLHPGRIEGRHAALSQSYMAGGTSIGGFFAIVALIAGAHLRGIFEGNGFSCK